MGDDHQLRVAIQVHVQAKQVIQYLGEAVGADVATAGATPSSKLDCAGGRSCHAERRRFLSWSKVPDLAAQTPHFAGIALTNVSDARLQTNQGRWVKSEMTIEVVIIAS
jgi:hypothetical protein